MEIRKKGYLPHRQRITIAYQKEHQVEVRLMTYAGSLQAKQDTWTRRRNWTLAGTLLLVAAGVGSRIYADIWYKVYQKTNTTKKAVQARQYVEQYDRYSQIFLIAAGVFGVWTLYNQIQRSLIKVPQQTLSLNYTIQPNRWMVGISLSLL